MGFAAHSSIQLNSGFSWNLLNFVRSLSKADFEMEGMVKIQANESRGYKGAPWTSLRISVIACATQDSQSVLYQTIIAHSKTSMY